MNPRFSALAIPAAFVAFASPIARAQLGDRILRTEAVIDASPADLWKARLEGAKLTRSNLYEAKLALAILSDCDLSGANLKKSSLEEG